MNITILNGDMKSSGEFSTFVDMLSQTFDPAHTVNVYGLQKMNLHYCMGCWSCWWKTPGECSLKDEGETIFRAVIGSDFVLFASPLMAGFTSSALKKITDRLIVLLHPYIDIREKECHHKKRYNAYPQIGLLLQREANTDGEDIEIVNDLYDRFAINFHTERKFTKFVENDSLEHIVYEICNC